MVPAKVAPQPAPAKRAPQRTMLGLPMEALPPAASPPVASPPAAQPPAPTKKAPARTMLGLPAVMPLPANAPAVGAPSAGPSSDAGTPSAAGLPQTAPVPAARAKGAIPARTMLGMPAAAVADAARAAQAAQAGRGSAAPGADAGRDSAPQTARTRRKSRPDMGLTMVGDMAPAGGAPAPVSDDTRPGRARASANYGMVPVPAPDSSDDLPALPRSKAPIILGAGLAALLVVGALVALGYAFLSGSTSVQAAVVQTDTGEALQVEVAEAPPGARLRLAGQEVPIEAGRATLPLASDTLHLGANELPLVLVGPDGDTEDLPLTLLVAYRVRADLSALEQRPAVLRYVVEAEPGSAVVLDGRPVTLDARGVGQRDYPVEASADDEGVERIVRYEVSTPAGVRESGHITTRVPYCELSVDRPGDELVTDQATVEVAGSADPAATVTLDGAPLSLREGRFLERVPLPEAREYRLQLMARQPGFAPRQREIVVRRVADLAAVAASYPVDRTLTYARIAQNPNIYRGQSVAIEGRVYHVDVHEGRSVLQMMARDCGGGQRCALWVTYPAATEATVGAWVRVVGDVAGEQSFQPRSGGATMTVPRVDARFVLPIR